MSLETKKIKILYVITKSNWGGAQRYVFDLASKLPTDKFEVAVTSGGNGVLLQKLQSINIRTLEIKSLKRNINLFKDIKLFWELFKIFRNEEPNIIHLNSSKMGFAGTVAARFLMLTFSSFNRNIPRIIFTVHGWPFNEDRPMTVKFIFKFVSLVSLALSTKIICVSENIKQQTPMLKIFTSKLSVIKNGIGLEKIYGKEEARALILKKITQKLNFDKNTVWLGSIAELTKNKGLEFGLEAMQKLSNENLHWFIIGEGDLEEKLKIKAIKLQIEKQVHFLGYLENASAYLKAFDVYLLPSITEALGYTLLEAGMAAIPIVASAVGGVPEIIEDKKTGLLVEPKNPKALANAITYILENKEAAKELRERLHQKVLTKFTLNSMLEKTLVYYIEIF